MRYLCEIRYDCCKNYVLGSCFSENKKYHESNLRNVSCDYQPPEWKRNSPEECKELCRKTPNCYKFTWVKNAPNWKNGINRCCLKKREEGMILTKGIGRISGPEDCGKLIFSIILFVSSS